MFNTCNTQRKYRVMELIKYTTEWVKGEVYQGRKEDPHQSNPLAQVLNNYSCLTLKSILNSLFVS